MSDAEAGLLYFPEAETHLIASRHVAQTFQIKVQRPVQKRGETVHCPVVYITDGNSQFEIAKEISLSMQATQRDAPPFILVSIGYPSDSFVAGGLLRGRDLTFPGCPKYFGNAGALPFEGVLTPDEGTKDFSGGEEFQRFIGEELIPFIDATYATIPDDRTYFGHSMGGGFGLFTLFTQTQLFRNYICSSPTICYDGETPDGIRHDNDGFMLKRAEAFLKAGGSLEGVQLYLSAGGDEELDPLAGRWQFVSGVYRLSAQLKRSALPGFRMMMEILPAEGHITVWPVAFTHGIQAMFGTRRIPDTIG